MECPPWRLPGAPLTAIIHAAPRPHSGGVGYSAVAAELLGVANVVGGCFGKRHVPGVSVDFAVDGDAAVVEVCGGYLTAPFGGNPDDEKLPRVVEAIDALG